MPDNQIDGMLEDFCLTLVPEAALTHTETFLEQAKRQGFANFKAVHHSKAKVHTWLGTQDEPGTPLGQAITLETSFKPYCGRFLLDIYWFFRTFALTVWGIPLSGQITEKNL